MLRDVLTHFTSVEEPAFGRHRHKRSFCECKLARNYGFEVIPDPENPGETGAIEMATQVCVRAGEESTLVIPADIPLIQAWELEEISCTPQPKEVSWFLPGTDAAQTQPCGVRQIYSRLRFGNDSFKPHHAAAQATGKPCVVLNLPGIAMDVDNPPDLQQLLSLPGETHAQRLARTWNLPEHLFATQPGTV